MKLSRASSRNRKYRTLISSYDSANTFENCNELKRLADEIDMSDIIDPTSTVCGKLMDIVARAKCLKEFELLPDGDLLYNRPSRAESPEGVGQASVKT